jgi:hypothetical protein
LKSIEFGENFITELAAALTHERGVLFVSQPRTKEYWMPNVGELEGMVEGRLQWHMQVFADLEWRRRRSIGEHNSH